MGRHFASILVLIGLFVSTLPIVNAQIDENLSITSGPTSVIHRGETIELYITVQNQNDDNIIAYFDFEEDTDLTLSGLPNDFEFNQYQARQFKFQITCTPNAQFGFREITVNITNNMNSNFLFQTNFSIEVVPYSQLEFGIQELSEFVVDPAVRTNLAINITNNGQYQDNVTYEIQSSSNWKWGWNMNSTLETSSYELLQPNQLAFVNFWIDVPEVINSTPLFMTGPTFSLIASSGLDYETYTWNFVLKMKQFRNISVINVGQDITLDPNSNDAIPITIRNDGNVDNLVDLKLEVIDSSGNIIDTQNANNRIEYDGWIVALFGNVEEKNIEPTETETIEVAFQAPDLDSGEINVRVSITPIGAVDKMKIVEVSSSILLVQNSSLDIISTNCQSILPEETCNPKFRLYNTGNFEQTYTVEIEDNLEFITSSNYITTYNVEENQYQDITDIYLTAAENSQALLSGSVQLNVKNDAGVIVATKSVETSIAPKVNWTIERFVQENDALGRLNIALTIKNLGNIDDGLIVQISSTHFTEMTLIPPEGAIIEQGVANPRTFEIDFVEQGANFTTRAWALIPTDQKSNGTMYVNLSVQSKFSPDEPFIFTSKVDFLGIDYQPQENGDSQSFASEFMEITIQYIKGWFWIILSIIGSFLIIFKSLKDREMRNQNKIQFSNDKGLGNSQPDDWMAKFEQKNQQVEIVDSPTIDADKFTRIFQQKSGPAKPDLQEVNENLTKAASLVLDSHDKDSILKDADNLIQEINTLGINQPLEDNDALKFSEYNTDMTNRNDPMNLIEKLPNKPDVKSVPLPEDDELPKDDDLDF